MYKLESYHGKAPEVPVGVEKYLNPLAEDHGNDGQVPSFLCAYHNFPSSAPLQKTRLI